MSTELGRIGEKARSDPQLVFTSVYHHICDVDNLRACFEALPGDRAVGIDGVTKEQYGTKLEENLKDLSTRLKDMSYRPQPKRRSYIPKPGSENRSVAVLRMRNGTSQSPFRLPLGDSLYAPVRPAPGPQLRHFAPTL